MVYLSQQKTFLFVFFAVAEGWLLLDIDGLSCSLNYLVNVSVGGLKIPESTCSQSLRPTSDDS